MKKNGLRLGHIYNDIDGVTVDRSCAFRYSEVSGWGFVAVGVFLANAWVLVS
jgi:hypothetical protein